jgi:hypothetical protein
MLSEKQLEANRQNALRSTGPNTIDGVEAIKMNALRHGLRSVQTVVPGEDPDAWEAHRAAVVTDIKPVGALELALAEQIAVKLWRLGRVVLFEANVIANAQDPEELAHAHEKGNKPSSYSGPDRTDFVRWDDVQTARKRLKDALEKLETLETAIRQLEAVAGMADEDIIDDWTIYDPLRDALNLGQDEAGKVFKDSDEPFRTRHIRALLRKRGKVEEVTSAIVAHWRDEKIRKLREAAAKAEAFCPRRGTRAALKLRSTCSPSTMRADLRGWGARRCRRTAGLVPWPQIGGVSMSACRRQASGRLRFASLGFQNNSQLT